MFFSSPDMDQQNSLNLLALKEKWSFFNCHLEAVQFYNYTSTLCSVLTVLI